MAIPKNKSELLAAIELNYSKLEADLISIPANLTTQTELAGHKKETKMSVSNLVAYLIGWGELVIKWHKKSLANKPIDFPETGYNWNQLGDLAQKFYTDYELDDYQTLLKKLARTKNQIIKIINSHDNKALYELDWYKSYPKGRLIQLNTSSPYKNARARIRKWKKEKGL